MALPAFGAEQDFKSFLNKYRDGVVNVMVHLGEGKQATGTGFMIRDGTLITSAHTLDGAQAVYARFPSGSASRCSLIDEDVDHDIAALHLESAPTPVLLDLAKETSAAPQELDEILLISNPLDLDFTPHLGRFSRTRETRQVKDETDRRVFRADFTVYQIDINATHGSSGGPLLDDQGRVIGIMAAGLDNGRLGLNFAVPHKFVYQLDLKKPYKEFSGGAHAPRLESSFAATKINYDHANAPILRSSNSSQVNLSSMNWGFIIPGAIGNFMDDPVKAGQLVTGDQFNQLAQRHRLIHVVNPFFHFSTVVPETFALHEQYDKRTRTFKAIYTHTGSGQKLTITATRIDPPADPQQMNIALDTLGTDFCTKTLGLVVTPNPIQPNEAMLGPFSDIVPRFGAGFYAGTVKFWRQYVSAQAYDTAHVVMYGVNRDVSIAVEFPYSLSQTTGPYLPDHIVERMFIASTVSFVR